MGILTVKLEKITNLKDADVIGKSDPYVELWLGTDDGSKVPGGFGKKESTKKKNDLNPVYNESFAWDFTKNKLESLDNIVLWMKIHDEDVGRDKMIGKASLHLGKFAPTHDAKEAKIPLGHGTGVIYLKVSYTEKINGDLTVVLDKVTHLVDGDLIGKSDPYVSFYLEQDNAVFDKGFGKKVSSKKKDDLNPVYNETFVWNKDLKTMENMVLWIKVLDDDIGMDKVLAKGKVDLENYMMNLELQPVTVSLESEKGSKTTMYLKIKHD